MIWTIISALLILIGIVGTVAPLLPGLPLAMTFLIDFFGPALGAAGRKASRYGTIGAVVGTIFGIFVFGPLGIVIGPLIGAFLAEYFVSKNFETAMQVTRRVFVAFVVGTAVKLGIVFSMAGYFVYLLLK